MKFGLLVLYLFLCGFVSSESIHNEVKDEPTVDDDVDNDAPELDSESDDSVSHEADNGAPDVDSDSDEAVDDDSKNEESFDESNSNPEQFDSEDEGNDVAENLQDQGDEDSKLEDPAPWRPKHFCKVVKVKKCKPHWLSLKQIKEHTLEGFTKVFYVKKCLPRCYHKTYYYYGKQYRKKICKKHCRNIRKTRKVCVKRCRPAKQKLCRYLFRKKICKSYLHCFLKPSCHYKRVVAYKTVCRTVPFFVRKCYKKCCFYFYHAKKVPLKPCGKVCIKRRKTKRVCKRKSFYKTIKVCKKKKICVKRVRCPFKYYYGPWVKYGLPY